MNSTKSKLLWSLLFLLIAAGTIWAFTSQNRSFSFASFLAYLEGASPGWFLTALASALGFIFFEAAAVAAACRAFGYRVRLSRGLVYSASDIYFSAITPSATGGQPACAYFMIRDGLPGTVATAALLANLTMYTLSILLIGLAVFLFFPGIFLSFSPLSKVLILLGYIFQLGLTAFFVLLLKNERLLHRLCAAVLHFLCKLRILRRKEEKLEKLANMMRRYGETVASLRGKLKPMIAVFFFNLLQRLCSVSVPLFVFLAAGGPAASAPLLWAMESYVIIGSNCIPIPGAMGVSDYLMLDAFESIMTRPQAANLELLSRSLSFYLCIILCGLVVLAAYLIQKRKEHIC